MNCRTVKDGRSSFTCRLFMSFAFRRGSDQLTVLPIFNNSVST